MNFLITGYQGFLGRYLAYGLQRRYPDAVIYGIGRSPLLTHFFTHNIRFDSAAVSAPLPEELAVFFAGSEQWYRRADLLDRQRIQDVLQELRPDIIVHLAAGLRDDPIELLFATNVLGTVRLIEAILRASLKLKKLILGSTGAVYGLSSLRQLPLREESQCSPADVYAISKLAAEHVARIFSLANDLPVVWARMFNLVGPGQDERHVCGKLASQISAIVRKRQAQRIEVGDLKPTRDYIDVRDAASALVCLAERGLSGETYNVASGNETSVESILGLLMGAANLTEPLDLSQSYARQNDLPRYYADVERLWNLGFRPRYLLKQSIQDLLGYYLETVPKCLRGAKSLENAKR